MHLGGKPGAESAPGFFCAPREFGVSTIAAMMLITAAMVLPFAMVLSADEGPPVEGLPLALAYNRFSRLNRGLRTASGLTSIAFGLFLVYEIGFVNGLFTTHPHWIPN